MASRVSCSPGGTDSRRNIDTFSACPGKGGCPRPSLMWQLWQPRALNSGPSPSDAWVELGDDTQILRNSALPSLNCSSCSKLRLSRKWLNESALTEKRVVPLPAGLVSKLSGLEKSVAGAVTARTRARSSP